MHIFWEIPTEALRDVPLASHICKCLPFPVDTENVCLYIQQNVHSQVRYHNIRILSAGTRPVCTYGQLKVMHNERGLRLFLHLLSSFKATHLLPPPPLYKYQNARSNLKPL